MTTKTLTIRLPVELARQLQEKCKASNSNPSAVLRRAAETYIAEKQPVRNGIQEHIAARAGTWDGYCSGKELLKRTRP